MPGVVNCGVKANNFHKEDSPEAWIGVKRRFAAGYVDDHLQSSQRKKWTCFHQIETD